MSTYRVWAPYLKLPIEWLNGNSAFEVRERYARRYGIEVSDVISLRYGGLA